MQVEESLPNFVQNRLRIVFVGKLQLGAEIIVVLLFLLQTVLARTL